MIETKPFNPLIPDATRIHLFKLETPRREPILSKSAMDLQREYCNKNNLPCFAFEVCPSCRQNTFEHPKLAGLAGETFVTGCPWCCESWCD